VPVVAGAIKYAAKLAQGNVIEVAKQEFQAAKKAKLDEVLKSLTKDAGKAKNDGGEVAAAPPKEVVTGEIAGIDIMDLEDAVQELWKNGIYAESGMGCTGPVVMISEANIEKAVSILTQANYVS
jgi:glycine reductase